jgi:uncharacterized protein
LGTLGDEAAGRVRRDVEALYAQRNTDVPFHGWHHVAFVSAKSVVFARELGADERLTEVAALVHDVNYLVDPKTNASGGAELRQDLLKEAGVTQQQAERIEGIVIEAEISSRGADISAEAKALSDADTLFKALPITPVVLAPLYMRETGRSIKELAEKIVEEQAPLSEEGIYFYSKSARLKYSTWGDANLMLWRCVLESLDDPDVSALLDRIPRA